MRFFNVAISFLLLLALCGSEIATTIARFNTPVKAGLKMCADRADEDSAEEENKNETETETEELKLKEQLTPDEFGYASLFGTDRSKRSITRHDLAYQLPDLKAVFSPPEILFS